MAKYNSYESPAVFLAEQFDSIKELRALYFDYNLFDGEINREKKDPRRRISHYFLGGLNPLLAIKKDVVDTFKPYKSGYYVQRDLLQPVRGLGNLVRGLFNLIVAPSILIFTIGLYIKMSWSEKSFKFFSKNLWIGSVKAAGGMLDGVTSIIRGALQILTTPLTLIFRLPIRGFLTATQGWMTVSQNLENKIVKLTALINKPHKTLDDAVFIDQQLRGISVKVDKAEIRGQLIDEKNKGDLLSFGSVPEFTFKEARQVGPSSQIRIILRFSVSDLAETREKALAFLGLFKTKAQAAAPSTSVEAMNDRARSY